MLPILIVAVGLGALAAWLAVLLIRLREGRPRRESLATTRLTRLAADLEEVRSSIPGQDARNRTSEQPEPSRFGHLLSEPEPSRLLHELVERIRIALDADAAAVIVSVPGKEPSVEALTGFDPGESALALVPASPRVGTIVLTRVVSAADGADEGGPTGLTLPLSLSVDGAVVMQVVAWNTRRDEPGEDEAAELRSVAADALPVIEVAFQLNRIQQLAYTDRPTGLYNRRFFDEALEREVDRARGFGRQLSLMMIDVDRFRHINDTLGRTVGDEALAAVADAMRRTVRTADLVFRVGGDEFAILLPEVGVAEADQLYERLKDALDEQQEVSFPLTISAGIAELVAPEGASSLVEKASAALLAAKRVQ